MGNEAGEHRVRGARLVAALFAAWAAWLCLYFSLPTITDFFADKILRLAPLSQPGYTAKLAFYQTSRMLMILALVIFFAGVARTFFSPERVRRLLAGRSEFGGCVLASALGVVTPFCNCSAVPLFIGFVEAGVPLGVTFAFLTASPLINEVALALLFSVFGWSVAALYTASGLAIAIGAGLLIGKLKMERFLEGWVLELRRSGPKAETNSVSWEDRIYSGLRATRETLGRVWLYVIIGIALGAVIDAYVPDGLLVAMVGHRAWWSVPAAVLVGAPMYSNPAGIVPIVQALLEKGATLGAALAFMMSVVGLSVPQILVLRTVLKPRAIAAFVVIVAAGIVVVGLLFNTLF